MHNSSLKNNFNFLNSALKIRIIYEDFESIINIFSDFKKPKGLLEKSTKATSLFKLFNKEGFLSNKKIFFYSA